MARRWGCLFAVIVGGVGLVLFGLGFDSHTTEAMPFGGVLLGVGLFVGLPSLQALRAAAVPGVRPAGLWLRLSLGVICVGLALVGLGAQPRTTEAMPFGLLVLPLGLVMGLVALRSGKPVDVKQAQVESAAAGPVASEPPISVRCENCGSPAPLRLAEPTHASCAHCGARFALPGPLVAVMRAAELVMRAQGAAERRISAILQSLPEKHVAWRARLLRIAGGLAAIAFFTAVFGWLRRHTDDGWHSYFAIGLGSGGVALVLGRSLARLIPRVAGGIVGHWAALQVPGVEGLACRVCGAALPSVAAPVLRCEYCGSDSLAGPAVQALVAQQAGHAVRSVLSVTQKDREADELAAFSMVAFPLVTLVAWFGVGAFAGGAGGRLLGEVHLPPASTDFAVLRVLKGGSPEACVAAVIPRGSKVELKFDGDHSVQLAPGEWEAFAVEPRVKASWFVGHHVNGLWKIDDVYSLLRSPHRVEAQAERINLYFPYDGLGGQSICLDDVSVSGAGLPLP